MPRVKISSDSPNPWSETNSALQKAVTILEKVVAAGHPVSLAELTLQLGLPRQTLHRTLQQMQEIGLLQREPLQDRYTVGARLRRLSFDTLSVAHMTGATHAILEGSGRGNR